MYTSFYSSTQPLKMEQIWIDTDSNKTRNLSNMIDELSSLMWNNEWQIDWMEIFTSKYF